MSKSLPCYEIIQDIRQYFIDAENIFNRKRRFDTDRRDFYARSMVVFALSNRLGDLAREVTYIIGIADPKENLRHKVYYKRLNDHQVINMEMREQMIGLVNIRNKISHHFFEISDDDLEKVYGLFHVYNEFVEIMEHEISRKNFEKKTVIGFGIATITIVILIIVWFFS